MRKNTRAGVITAKTHEGGQAAVLTPIQQLERLTLACMLWEDGLYEDGQTVSNRIKTLSSEVGFKELAELAVRARTSMKLRHVPLLLVREMARHPDRKTQPSLVSQTLTNVIRRADEITEFLALYWEDGKCPLSKQVKTGLAHAFLKFDEYQLAKYNRDTPVKLRDALFLCHAKPDCDARAALWKRLVDNELAIPDTWETNLSAGEDKHATFTRLLQEGKLGYMALLRNLRNMRDSGVATSLVFDSLRTGAARSMALPFRFLAAARQVPEYEHVLDEAMQLSLAEFPKLKGKTVVLVDVSGSMDWAKVSAKSDITSMDAGAALAALVAGVAEDFEIYTFSKQVVKVPSRKGMALIPAVINSQGHGGTMLGNAINTINHSTKYDRIIVFTDEQSGDMVGGPAGRGYMVNVASNKHGVGYGPWTRITGFSEAVIQYIQALEASE